MRIVYPESRRFRISFVVERVCRSANTGCPVPSRGPDFLCSIRSCGLPRVRAAAFSRTGPGRGRVGPFREFVRPGASRVFLQSVSMCRHAGPELLCCQADECPGVFPFLDRLRLLFQQPTPPEAGLRLPSFRFAGPRPGKGRPSRRVFRRPLRRGGRALPGRTSEDMVSYDRRGRAPSLRRRDASGMPNEIVLYLRYAVHHGFSGGRSRFSNASRSPLRQRIFPQ